MTTTSLLPPDRPKLDFQLLNKELDRTKSRVFLGKNAAFLGRLMCSLEFQWDESIPTAATNGIFLKWNPYYFHFLCNDGRNSILVHELWHVALMHMLRRGTRDGRIWNHACDTVLDNMMDLDGYLVDGRLFPEEAGFPPGCKTFVNHAEYGDMSAEEIYDLMIQNPPPPPPAGGGGAGDGPPTGIGQDLVEPDAGDSAVHHTVLNNVVAAVHAAKLGGMKPGDLPGELETVLNKFLSPKLPWAQLLANWFNQMDQKDYSWSKPNRRYRKEYLPGMVDASEGLDHVMYFLDVSGSVTDEQVIRFHSEFKHVKDTYRPKKMTMVQFDTRIQKEDVFLADDEFEETHLVGRGGTCFKCVRQHILDNNPTAVVIFSDMYVNPMQEIPLNARPPILWVAVDAGDFEVPHGQVIRLNE